MIDLEAIMDALVLHLRACLPDSGETLEGVLPLVGAVQTGAYVQPTPNAGIACVEWGGDNYPFATKGTLFAASDQWDESTDLFVRTYFFGIDDEDAIAAVVRQHRSQDSGAKGMVPALRRFRLAGIVFAPVAARYIPPTEKPELRHSGGLEVRCTVRQFG